MKKAQIKSLLDYSTAEIEFYTKVHQDLQELNRNTAAEGALIPSKLPYTQEEISEASRFRQLTLEAEINEELYY